MIVKCNKTGKILFDTKEAQKHAEEIGSQDFTEIAEDSVLLVDAETKRRVFHGGVEEVGDMRKDFCLFYYLWHDYDRGELLHSWQDYDMVVEQLQFSNTQFLITSNQSPNPIFVKKRSIVSNNEPVIPISKPPK